MMNFCHDIISVMIHHDVTSVTLHYNVISIMILLHCITLHHNIISTLIQYTSQTIDEGMIALKARLSYVQYLPAKPVKRAIMVWMCCDADTAYLHQFQVYLGQQQNSEFGLGYDVVMKPCKDISGKNHHVYCDNLFTSVQLLKDLLQWDNMSN